MSTFLEVVQVVVGGATVVGLCFAAWEVLRLVKEGRERARREIAGVSVTWETLESPTGPDSRGRARWRYKYVITNPGGMPIDNVECSVEFPLDVRRVRFNGEVEPPSRSMTLQQPVIVGGGQRTWTRTLELDFAERAGLGNVSARVTFRDIAREQHTNVWPRMVG